jgi:hypothetical protein
MDPTDLRPLSLGELLDRTFRLYRNHFWLFVGIMAVPSAFSIPFMVLFFPMQNSAFSGRAPSPKLIIGTLVLALISYCIFVFVYALGVGAATLAVSDVYLGQETTVRGAYKKVWGNFWRIIGVVVVAMLRIFGMFFLIAMGMGLVIGISFVILGALSGGTPKTAGTVVVGILTFFTYIAGIGACLVWSQRYAVSIPSLLLEHVGVLAALRRSVQLTKGRRWHLLAALFLSMTIAYVGVIVFQGPFFITMMFSMRGGAIPDWLGYTMAMSGAIGSAITGPILMIALVLCYYDTRIRKEAFDLQFMMSSLEPAPPATNAGTPA